MTEDQKKEFKRVSDLMIDFLIKNGHPHVTVIITQTYAELLEGEVANARD